MHYNVNCNHYKYETGTLVGVKGINSTDLKNYLSSKNIKPSYPRIKIYEYLSKHHTHPTVDEIYLSLLQEMPTLSKTTIYNTLKIFIEKGLVKLVTIEDNETRYDVDTNNHGHFKCENCRKIYDFPVNLEYNPTAELNGFHIKEKNIYFKGICGACNNELDKVKE